ncbi:MAG: M48 family metalloprotease [Flavobacteriaceae bacterium]
MRLLFTFFITFPIFAQVETSDFYPSSPEQFYASIDKIIQHKIDTYQGNYKKQQSEIWEEKKEEIIKEIKSGDYIFNDSLHYYLRQIALPIYQKNPEIDGSGFQFFIKRSPVPNAASLGNGIFIINSGLFSLVENDDELAFIICHEIAHFHLKHSDVSLEEFFNSYESKETKSKIDAIAKENEGRFSKALDLLKDINYSLRKKSRSQEIEADSLGLIYFLNTQYNKAAAKQVLSKLDFEEEAILNKEVLLKKHLTTQGYPFKDAWLVKETGSLFDIDEASNDYAFDKDSTKTHPAIPKRVKILSGKIPGNDNSIRKNFVGSLKEIGLAKTIEGAIAFNELDIALYYLLTSFEEEKIPASLFYSNTSVVLKKLYELKKDHSVGRYIPPISPFSDEEQLNKIRTFIAHLEPKNIRKLGYWFCLEHKEQFNSKEEYNAVFNFFEALNSKN